MTVLEAPIPVRLGRKRDRRRYHVTKVAICRTCGEGIAYLREPGVWLHRFGLKMDGRLADAPGALSYDHAARPGPSPEGPD